MTKELEALNKIQHDFGQLKGQELVSCYEIIFNALKRLEAIDNSNPSEALKWFGEQWVEYGIQDTVMQIKDTKEFATIQQALLKAQEQEKVLNEALKLNSEWAEELDYYRDLQEPKKYLKWEDLEFTNKVKEMKVKLVDNTYEIEYYISNALNLPQPVVILKTSDFIATTNEQFFNALHLERVEE